VAPAGTPRPIVDKLNGAINDGLKSQAAADKLANFSAIAKLGTPEDFKAFLAEQTEKWASIVKLADARIE
jgi:tripartite-type tricarboxylate transporter receptor subunit TctC